MGLIPEVSLSDIASKAPIASPTFTGTPAAPTASQGTNTTQIATTAFVNAEIAADTAAKAPLASPTFTGVPAAPTASQGTNTTQLATTAFVNTEIASDIAGKADLAGPTFTGVPAAPTASQGTNTTQIATTAFVNAEIAADIAGKADLAGPTFTGVPAAPTAAQGTNTTQLATTAYVQGEIGQSIQAHDADTAKTDVAQTFTPAQTFTAASVHNGGLTVDGPYKQVAETVSGVDIDLSTGNYFTKTVSGNTTFTFSNPPANGTVGSFTLEVTHSSGNIYWPGTVKWPDNDPPSLATGKTHLFMFITDNNGGRYRGAALVDYPN